MDILFDVQELWMRVENMPFKRPKESDFNLMAQLIADKKYWTGIRERKEETEESNETEEQYEVETEDVNCANLLSDDYDEDAYEDDTGDYSGEDDDMGGPVIDDYVPEEAKESGTHSSGEAEVDYELPPESKRGHYIDDEDSSEEKGSGGLDYEALDAIEKEVAEQRKGIPKPQQPAPSRKPDGIRAARDHKSNLLNDGGE